MTLFLRLPRHIQGLWLVSGIGVVVALASLAHAWRRPVSALSGIAPYSDVVDVNSGVILKAPRAKYAHVDLNPGDRIIQYADVRWEHAQRLNLHEMPEAQAGDIIHIIVQRGAQSIHIPLLLTLPNAWEQLVLHRYSIAALALLATPTVLLWTLSRDVLHRKKQDSTLGIERSSLPSFIVMWQGVAFAQILASFKYPVAFLWTDVLTPVLALFIGLISLPHPLAPHTARPRWVEVSFLIMMIVSAAAIIWQASQSPFPTTDWRRQVQLIRPTDTVWQWTRVPIAIGISCAVLGIFATAFSRVLPRTLLVISRRTPSPVRKSLLSLNDRIVTLYEQCPTSVRIIAEFQLTIILLYLLLDIAPRTFSRQGGGYSILFATIPLSYLLLYSDTQAQKQGRWLLRVMLIGIGMIQLPNLGYQIATGRYGMGATPGDIATLLLVAVSSIGGGFGIAVNQWLRRRGSWNDTSPIDGLFVQETQAAFWHHLVQEVGRRIGVDDWMWIGHRLPEREAGETPSWHVIEHTSRARISWLDEPGVSAALERLSSAHTYSVAVEGSVGLPSTLVLLPIYRNDMLSEVLIAINPQWTSGTIQIEHPIVVSRLMQAVNVLRSREREHAITVQQTYLAEQRGKLNEAYRQITRAQRSDMFRANLRFSSLLHDVSLPQVAILLERIRQQQNQTDISEQEQALQQMEQQCHTLYQELRRIAGELRPAGVGQRLRFALEQMVMEWEQQHRAIHFEYRFVADETALTEYQRDTIYMIVQQLVTNALEHAAATLIEIVVREENHHLIVEVNDNGHGFTYDPEQVRPDALGILTRRDMARDLGGELTIDTQPGAGCRMRLALPRGR
jgi:signal transduction histidine kinase